MVSHQSGTGIVRLDCDNDDNVDDAQCGAVVFPADDNLCHIVLFEIASHPSTHHHHTRVTCHNRYSSKHALAWVAEDVATLRQQVHHLTHHRRSRPVTTRITPHIITQRRPFAQGVSILECTQTSGDIIYVPSMCVRVTCDLMRDVRRVCGMFLWCTHRAAGGDIQYCI